MTVHSINPQQNVAKQQGVGMIEILVTLFILSIGLLGVASLQFVGSFSNSEALNRSQAVMVAQQFSERLRASAKISNVDTGLVVDNQYFDANIYNFSNLSCVSGALPYQCFCETHPADIPNCNADECDATEIAQFDAYEMSCAAVQQNPNLNVSLSCVNDTAGDTDACSSGARHAIQLTWPVASWQNLDQVLNSKCNISRSTPHDCVIVEITL